MTKSRGLCALTLLAVLMFTISASALAAPPNEDPPPPPPDDPPDDPPEGGNSVGLRFVTIQFGALHHIFNIPLPGMF